MIEKVNGVDRLEQHRAISACDFHPVSLADRLTPIQSEKTMNKENVITLDNPVKRVSRLSNRSR